MGAIEHWDNSCPITQNWDQPNRLVAEQGFDGRRIDYGYDSAGCLRERVDGVAPGTANRVSMWGRLSMDGVSRSR